MVRSQGARSLPVGKAQRAKSLTIGELAAAGGVGVETIRFYQRRDLLRTPARGGGIRHYGGENVRRLRFIRQAQAAGFTLEEIRELLELDAGEDRSRARDALPRLASECGEGSTGPCPILASFDV